MIRDSLPSALRRPDNQVESDKETNSVDRMSTSSGEKRPPHAATSERLLPPSLDNKLVVTSRKMHAHDQHKGTARATSHYNYNLFDLRAGNLTCVGTNPKQT